MSITDLPTDMLFKIICSLPKEDVASFVSTCYDVAKLTVGKDHFYDWAACKESFVNALIYAIERRDLAGFRRLINKVPHGFNINTSIDGDDYVTILSIAAKLGHIPTLNEMLRFHGIDVNQYALHAAARSGQMLSVATLLNHPDIDPNTLDNYGFTPLHIACMEDDAIIVALLVGHNNINVNAEMAETHETPLHLAVYRSSTDVLKVLLGHISVNVDARDENGMTVLHTATAFPRIANLKVLLADSRFDVNAQDPDGITPLHAAAMLTERVDPKASAEAVGLLIAAPGINVNAQTVNGMTPLHHAVMADNVAVAEVLVRAAGVDVNVVNLSGETALDIASRVASDRMCAILRAF